MKYKIPQERLDKVVFRYLDLNYGDLEKIKGKHADIVFKKSNSDFEYGIIGWKKTNDLFIYYKLFDEISDMFSLKESDSEKVIGRWVEDRHKLKVDKTHLIERFAVILLKIDIN